MSLRPFSAFSISCSAGLFSSSSISVYAFPNKFLCLSSQKPRSSKFLASVSKETDVVPLEGEIFQPFEELKNVGCNVSYVYHAMFAYFDRDNIALKGLAKFFKKSSEKQREHAEKLIKYQNIRGGIVTLHSVVRPQSDLRNALSAMELALSLEKLKNEKLLNLHRVVERNGDPPMAEFIESEFLTEQVEVIKKIAEFISQLRMVGEGHGVWHFDQNLLHEDDA